MVRPKDNGLPRSRPGADHGIPAARRSRSLQEEKRVSRPDSFNKALLGKLIEEIEAIRLSAHWMEKEYEGDLQRVSEGGRESATNLLHYLALRRRDLRDLQSSLAELGLSSLGRAEAHVMGSLDRVLEVLECLAGNRPLSSSIPPTTIALSDGRKKLQEHTRQLLGTTKAAEGDDGENPVRVMVTMPSTAAVDYELVRSLLQSGMSCMRVNCAHDDRETWSAMIRNLDKARLETGKSCRVFMDLAGPKIRTGAIEPGPRILKWEPKRDVTGTVIAPALVWLTPAEQPDFSGRPGAKVLPLPHSVIESLQEGDSIEFRDLRGRARTILVRSQYGSSWVGELDQITYLGSETPLLMKRARREGSVGTEFRADAILAVEQSLSLMAGDILLLTADPALARPVLRDDLGRLMSTVSISCTAPEVFAHVKEGERVMFDDGKITGKILSVAEGELMIEISQPEVGPKKLRADKGINFPDSDLQLPSLTAKDLEDLDFVLDHADIIGFSFVNRVEDVEALQEEIAVREKGSPAIVLKIETEKAFQRLPFLILAALRSYPVGVMVARGDLAVECGYQRLAEVQEEILWICEAAHVPVIWATQVLDRLNKKGVPTRAEVTDAAMSERAECVMLNKGPHVIDSVRLLGEIIPRMREHQEKKTPRLRALRVSRGGGEN